MTDVQKWTVYVRADGRSDVDAGHALRRLTVSDLDLDVLRWIREPRSLIAEAIVEAADEDAAYERGVTAIAGALDATWIVGRSPVAP